MPRRAAEPSECPCEVGGGGGPAGPGGALNRLSYQLARQSIWQAFRPADRRMRKQLLGLPAAPLLGAFDAECTRHTPILYGYSPAVIPPAPDWDARTHVTGYWFLEKRTTTGCRRPRWTNSCGPARRRSLSALAA